MSHNLNQSICTFAKMAEYIIGEDKLRTLGQKTSEKLENIM